MQDWVTFLTWAAVRIIVPNPGGLDTLNWYSQTLDQLNRFLSGQSIGSLAAPRGAALTEMILLSEAQMAQISPFIPLSHWTPERFAFKQKTIYWYFTDISIEFSYANKSDRHLSTLSGLSTCVFFQEASCNPSQFASPTWSEWRRQNLQALHWIIFKPHISIWKRTSRPINKGIIIL